MARPLWSGSLSFGLVNVPVRLVSGVRDLDLHFRQLHEPDAAPIDIERYCEKEGKEVPYEEIAHGYDLDDGGQVVITDEELEAVEPRRTRTIDIEQFVDLTDIDPVYFDHPYFLLPAGEDDGTLRAYSLLVKVMERTERAALGRFVLRAKEHLAIIRARGGALALTTMRFGAEVRSPDGLDVPSGRTAKPSSKELNAAQAVIEELTAPWEPEELHDCYRERLEQVVARKRKGETVQVPDSDSDGDEPAHDLMEALERTLAEIGGGKR